MPKGSCGSSRNSCPQNMSKEFRQSGLDSKDCATLTTKDFFQINDYFSAGDISYNSIMKR